MNARTATSTSTTTSTLLTTATDTATVTSTETASSTDLEGTSCSTPVTQPPPNGTNIYYLTAPSEAAICITYEYSGRMNATYVANLISVTGGSCLSSECQGMNASVSPRSVAYDGPTNITLTYRISTTSELSDGLYWLQMVPTCLVAVLAYGKAYSQINLIQASLTSCVDFASGPIAVWVVGISNMTYSEVPFGATTNQVKPR